MTIGIATIKEVPIVDLAVDPMVQRPLDRNRVRDIANDFRPEALGVVTVSLRETEEMILIDGQHRCEGAKEAGFGSLSITARMLEGLTLAEEAELFRLLNNTRKPQYLELFKVRVVEGDPNAVGIHDMVTELKWTISPGSREGQLSAVAALERAWRRDPEVARAVLVTVTDAWGHDPAGVVASLIEGLSMVYMRYRNGINKADLADRLARYPGGAGALIGKSRGLRDLYGSHLSQAVAELLVELYNRRRRANAIDPWRSVSV